jgi:hypothetical protein
MSFFDIIMNDAEIVVFTVVNMKSAEELRLLGCYAVWLL